MDRRFGTLLAIMMLFAWGACGGSEPEQTGPGEEKEEEEETPYGSLEISFKGLPEGLKADTTVTGPQGFSASVVEDTLLEELTPGRYAIESVALETGTLERYVPTVYYSETDVEADETARVTIEYDFEEILPFSLHSEGAAIALHGSGNIEVSLTRNEGFEDRVEIRLEGVPAGVAGGRGTISGSETSTTLSLISNGSLRELGTRTITIVGQAGPHIVRQETTLRVDAMVTSLADTGEGTLRHYLGLSSHLKDVEGGPATITFDPDLSGTINLQSTFVLNGETIVRGPDYELGSDEEPRITITAARARRILEVEAAAEVEFYNLSFVDGHGLAGGAIFNEGALTLGGMHFDSNEATQSGGAIYNAGTLVITDSHFDNNVAADDGGAIMNAGSAELSASSFQDNEATTGGAIWSSTLGAGGPASLTLRDVSLGSNQAEDGGALFVSSSLLHVEGGSFQANWAEFHGAAIRLVLEEAAHIESHFENNSAGEFGGALYVTAGMEGATDALRIERSSFIDNRAAYGAGIASQGLEVLVDSSLFAANSAQEDGGGLYLESDEPAQIFDSTFEANVAKNGGGVFADQELLVRRSAFVENTATEAGGGIAVRADTVVLNTTMDRNRALSRGGAVQAEDAVLTVLQSTLTENNAATRGGAIENSGTVRIGRSILWENSSGSGSGPDIYTDPANADKVVTLGYNFFRSISGSQITPLETDEVNYPPALASLDDNGGPTPTRALGPTSPALNHVPLDACVDHLGNPLTQDQRGALRPAGAGCDVGAFELQPED